MASRFLARSKTLALALSRADAAPAPLAGSSALSSLPRYPAAAATSPTRPGMVGIPIPFVRTQPRLCLQIDVGCRDVLECERRALVARGLI